MNSYICEGTVMHARTTPKQHKFNYQVFMMLVDLQKMEQIFSKYWLWSIYRRNLAYLKRSDHLGDPNTTLYQAVCDYLLQETNQVFNGKVYLLTNFRYYGYCFNPISVYYCYDNDAVKYFILEVHNTPWGERQCYLLDNTNLPKDFVVKKNMHVSPFINMDMEYLVKLRQTDTKLAINMQVVKQTQQILQAKLSLRKKKLTQLRLFAILLKYPFMTLKVIMAIHYQALLLWLKGVKVVYHPKYKKDKI